MIPTPPTPPHAAAPDHPALALACALNAILFILLHHVAAAFRPLARFTTPAWNRISRANQRVAAILRRLAAGTYPRARRPTAPGAAPRRGGPSAPYLPRRPGWLIHTAGYQIANCASQLRHLLAQPETLATIAAAPPHAQAALARALATPCRLLGVTLPPALQPPPSAPRAPPSTSRPARTKPRPRARPTSESAQPALQRLLPAGFKITLFKPA